jgi:uncharacterized membrane protein
MKSSKKEKRQVFSNLDRINSFSDGVFAVAITLLVLSIAVPALEGAHTNANLLQGLSDVWEHFFAYALSFAIIGGFWYRHHALFDRLERYDSRFVVINMALLMFIVFIPYPTSMIGKYSDISLAVAIYSGTLMITCVLMGALAVYATRGARLVEADFDFEYSYGFVFGYATVASWFFLSAGVAFLNASAGLFFLIGMPVASFIVARTRPFHSRYMAWIAGSPRRGGFRDSDR